MRDNKGRIAAASYWPLLLLLGLSVCRPAGAPGKPGQLGQPATRLTSTPVATATALRSATMPRPPTPTVAAAGLFPLPPSATAEATVELKPPTPAGTPSASLSAPESPASWEQLANPETIGYSAQGREIGSYQFGNGASSILFVGGMHGGYEWNTVLLAYQAIDYFRAHQKAVPDSVTLFIIPSANPDGQYLVTGSYSRFSISDVISDTIPGRFNANNVDLNRNWDCNWSASAVWRQQAVESGSRPFSEPESQALRDFLLAERPAAVVFWHSAADGVYAASCPEVFAPSYSLAQLYGQAASYPVYDYFSSYTITGDAADWLARQGMAAITVELKNHEDLEWAKNLAGMLAVLDFYGQSGSEP